MPSYAIENIPIEFISAKSACTVAVCLAKNNPLLCDSNNLEAVNVIHTLLRELSAKHTTVYVLIADEINVYERLISNGTGRNQAVRYAEAEGSRIKELYQKYATDLNLPNLKVIRWKEIQDENYEKTVAQLRDIVSIDSSLAQLLRETAIFYIKRRNPSVTINDRRINHFQDYLLNEMVVQLHGIKESKIIYHAVYLNRLEDAGLYQSPVLDLKRAFKKFYSGCDAHTSRVFISSPTLSST